MADVTEAKGKALSHIEIVIWRGVRPPEDMTVYNMDNATGELKLIGTYGFTLV